jgi:hypothetical protein
MSEDNDELGSNLEPAQPIARKRAKPAEERIWILLEENEEIPPTGQFFGHNGNGMIIKPGEPVHAPAAVIDILNHAVITVPVLDPTTKRVIGHRDRMRFPYRRVDAPADAE